MLVIAELQGVAEWVPLEGSMALRSYLKDLQELNRSQELQDQSTKFVYPENSSISDYA
jgi:hypothetical protein